MVYGQAGHKGHVLVNGVDPKRPGVRHRPQRTSLPSTLIKILTGFQRPDPGRILVDGKEVRLRSVSHARSLGIDTVYQDLALVPGLSVTTTCSSSES